MTETEKIVFFSRMSAHQLALAAKQSPSDSTIDTVLTKRIKMLSFCLRDWVFPLPLQDRQHIIQCIHNGTENPSPDFFDQLKQVTLPAYQQQSPGLQKMFFGILEKFSELAPVNFNEERRHFFQFFYEHLEHNAIVDRLDQERQIQAQYGTRSATSFEKRMDNYR